MAIERVHDIRVKTARLNLKEARNNLKATTLERDALIQQMYYEESSSIEYLCSQFQMQQLAIQSVLDRPNRKGGM